MSKTNCPKCGQAIKPRQQSHHMTPYHAWLFEVKPGDYHKRCCPLCPHGKVAGASGVSPK